MFFLRRYVPNPALERSMGELLRPINELPEGQVRDKVRELQSRASRELFRFVAWPIVIFMMPSVLAVLAVLMGKSIYRRLTRKRDEIARTIEVEAIESELEDFMESEVGRLQPA
jgi:hypothetical protein